MLSQKSITDVKYGQDVVEILSFGCIQYMLDHDIPLTAGGFERLVTLSKDTGLNGRIAFQTYEWTQRKLQALFAQGSGLPVQSIDSEKRLNRLRKRPSIRKRLLAHGLGDKDTAMTDDEKIQFLQKMREMLGDDIADVFEQLVRGDCQRELVWNRIEEIKRAGDVERALEKFKTNSDE